MNSKLMQIFNTLIRSIISYPSRRFPYYVSFIIILLRFRSAERRCILHWSVNFVIGHFLLSTNPCASDVIIRRAITADNGRYYDYNYEEQSEQSWCHQTAGKVTKPSPLMIADGREFRNVLRYNGRLARQRLSTFITTDAFRRFWRESTRRR